MSRPTARALVLACLLAALAIPSAHADYHVAPNGNDANPGTAAKPFATLPLARAAVRTRIAAGLKANITVLLHAGTYPLAEPLAFGTQDSGTQEHAITYAAAPGDKVVVSGGRRITGWTRGKGDIWTAALPEAKGGKWRFRNLWVNGRRATRARLPNADAKTPRLQLQAAGLSKDLKSYTLKLAPGIVKHWKCPSDIEVMVDGNWAINRKRVQRVDAKTGTITLAPPHRQSIPWNRPRKGRWCYLENSPSFLDQSGEWALDPTTGILSYWPLPGEDMAKAEVVAPVLTRLVEVKGTAKAPVRNLHFVGITFAHTDWQIPDVGYFGVQACHHVEGQGKARVWTRIPAAVRFDHAHDCSVRNGAIAHAGTCGIEMVEGCQRDTIEGNHIFDISANGVMLGGPKDEAGVPKHCRIANNHVHATGIEYHGAVGIWVGFAQRAVVAHNEVHDMPYSGISLGWQWNPQPTPCKANTIAWNHIHDVMKNLGDGGGIYTLGFQPGTIIRGNHIHDARRSRFAQAAPNNGMFIDEGSKGFLFERNVIYRTAHQPARHNRNRPEWHTWRDNHFGIAAPAPGKVGMALACDGRTTVLQVPHSAKLEPEHLTLEAWVHLDHFPTRKETRRWIVGKNRNEWEQGHYALCIDSDKVGAYLNIGGGPKHCIAAWSAEGQLTLRRWHHLAMTYDGATLAAYLDGKRIAAKTVNAPRTPGKGPLAIGRRQDGYVTFNGLIDEVRIYSRALPADTLKAHAQKPDAIAHDTTLVGHWSFDALGKGNEAINAITAKASLEAPYRKRLLGGE